MTGVGVPALGQHRDGDDAADLLAEPSGAAHGVHHLAQQVALVDLALDAAGALARGELALELLDLGRGRLLYGFVERRARLELARVDQQRPWARPPAAVFVVVAEQFEMAGMESCALAFLGATALEPGEPFEHQLRNGGVPAHDDEHGRHADADLSPAFELTRIVAV